MTHSTALIQEYYKLEALNQALLFACGVLAMVAVACVVLYALERRAHSHTRDQANTKEKDLIMRLQAWNYDVYMAQKVADEERELPEEIEHELGGEEGPTEAELELQRRFRNDLTTAQEEQFRAFGPMIGG